MQKAPPLSFGGLMVDVQIWYVCKMSLFVWEYLSRMGQKKQQAQEFHHVHFWGERG